MRGCGPLGPGSNPGPGHLVRGENMAKKPNTTKSGKSKVELTIPMIVILAIVSLVLGGFSSTLKNDLLVHSSSARVIVGMINGEFPEAREVFGYNLFRPASLYYIFYVVLFPVLKSTKLIIALYYSIYFFLFFLASISISGKTRFEWLITFTLISLNLPYFFGLLNFLIGVLVSILIIANLRDNPKKMLFFSVLSFPIIYFIHPIASLIFAVLSSAYFTTDIKNPRFFFSLLLFAILFVLFSLAYYGISFNEGVKSLEGGFSALNYFLVLKIIGLFQLPPFFVLSFLLVFSLFFRIPVENKDHYTAFLALLLFVFLAPEKIGLYFSTVSRTLPFLLLFYAISKKDVFEDKKMAPVYALIAYVLLVFSLYFIYFPELFIGENVRIVPLYLSDVEVSFERPFYIVFADSLEVKDTEEIDRGEVVAYYVGKGFPLYYKDIISPFEHFMGSGAKELLGMFFSKLDFLSSVQDYCAYIKENVDSVCKFHDVIVSPLKCDIGKEASLKYVYIGKDEILFSSYVYSC